MAIEIERPTVTAFGCISYLLLVVLSIFMFVTISDRFGMDIVSQYRFWILGTSVTYALLTVIIGIAIRSLQAIGPAIRVGLVIPVAYLLFELGAGVVSYFQYLIGHFN